MIAVSIVLAVIFAKRGTFGPKLVVEDVFLLGKDGRLIMHTTRHQRADRDEDSLAGMVSAIMAFIRESYEEGDEEDFKSFTFTDRQVHVQRDTYFYFVSIYADEPPESAQDSIAAITRDIEKGYGGVLEEWRGDASEVRELRAFTNAFVARRRYRKGDWRRHATKAK